MEQIRKIVRKNLFELYLNDSIQIISKLGEYSTEEMESFLFNLIELIPFGENNYGNGPTINIPSSWPASSVSYTKDSAIQNWEKAKKYYGEPDTKWYVWKSDVDSVNKPKHLSAQRLDIDSILRITSINPEAFKSMSIGVKNERTDRLENNIDTKGD